MEAAPETVYPPNDYYNPPEKRVFINKEYVRSLRAMTKISEAMLSASAFISLTAINTFNRNWGKEWVQFVTIAALSMSGFQLFIWTSRCIKLVPFFAPVYLLEVIIAATFVLFYASSIIIVTIEAHASVLTLYACSFLCLIAMVVFAYDTYQAYEVWKSPNSPIPNPKLHFMIKKRAHSAGPAVMSGIYPGGPWNPHSNRVPVDIKESQSEI